MNESSLLLEAMASAMNITQFTLADSPPKPLRLIVPQQPADSAGSWMVMGIAGYVLAAALLILAAACYVAWRRERRLAGSPVERAFEAIAATMHLSSSQRQALTRIAGHLGAHVPPVALILSRSALRRAVAMELELKPEPKSVRELQKLVEKLVGEIAPTPHGETPRGVKHKGDAASLPSDGITRARAATPVRRRTPPSTAA